MQLTTVIRRLQAISSSETHKIKKKKSDFFLIQKHSLLISVYPLQNTIIYCDVWSLLRRVWLARKRRKIRERERGVHRGSDGESVLKIQEHVVFKCRYCPRY